MNCLKCSKKSCRTAESCGREFFDRDNVKDIYHGPGIQRIVQRAAELVDGGRAGNLSRLDELLEFIPSAGYKKPALAYCYGMEKEAVKMASIFKEKGIDLIGVSCTTGAHSQNELNRESDLPGVSCNPVAQAEQLNKQGSDLAIIFGLCMGHDILFTSHFDGDVTTFLVKDRVHKHNPLLALSKGL